MPQDSDPCSAESRSMCGAPWLVNLAGQPPPACAALPRAAQGFPTAPAEPDQAPDHCRWAPPLLQLQGFRLNHGAQPWCSPRLVPSHGKEETTASITDISCDHIPG